MLWAQQRPFQEAWVPLGTEVGAALCPVGYPGVLSGDLGAAGLTSRRALARPPLICLGHSSLVDTLPGRAQLRLRPYGLAPHTQGQC